MQYLDSGYGAPIFIGRANTHVMQYFLRSMAADSSAEIVIGYPPLVAGASWGRRFSSAEIVNSFCIVAPPASAADFHRRKFRRQ